MTLDRSVLSGSRPRGRWLRRTGVATLGGAALVLSVVLAPAAQSASQPQAKTGKAAPTSDVREVNPNKKLSTKNLTLNQASKAQAKAEAKAAAAGTPAVGTTRTLLAEDDFNGILYRKSYTLQAVGPHIEVWVAADTVVPGRRLPQRGGQHHDRDAGAGSVPGRPVRDQDVPGRVAGLLGRTGP